jgi:two-component system NtrC family sensor kinase
MKLAAKLVLLFLACLGLVVSVFSFLSLRPTENSALAEHEQLAADLAAILETALRAAPHSMADVQQVLIAKSEEVHRVRVRLVNPNRPQDSSLRPSVPAELVVRSTEVTTVFYPDDTGHDTMYTYVPLHDAAGTRLEVAAQQAYWLELLSESFSRSAIALLVVSAVTSLVILLGGFWMVGKPLDQLVEKVHRIGQGDLSGRIDLKRDDELGRLGQAINEMCDQLQHQRTRIASETQQRLAAVEQLRHADRLRTVGRLAAGLAHEIGTPLNVVSGRAELIASGRLTATDIEDSARTIKQQSQRITTIVQELLNFARSKKPQRLPTNLNELLEETLKLIRPMVDKKQVTLLLTPSEHQAHAEVDAAQLQQVFTNLLVNALQATTAGGQIIVGLEKATAAQLEQGLCRADVITRAAEYWLISVRDTGQGIAPEVIDNIFEPFFTTKDVGEGTGLGLSIAYGIVREHGGCIGVTSEVGKGATFQVALPASQGLAN